MSKQSQIDLTNIKLLGLDVDGVLTNGQIIHGGEIELKAFSVKDGAGIRFLQQSGIEVVIITARTSTAVTTRAAELGIKSLHQGAKNKLSTLQGISATTGIALEEMAYMGDDLPDLAVIQSVAVGACPADASELVARHCQWRSTKRGGDGAVREFAEAILMSQNKLSAIIENYGA